MVVVTGVEYIGGIATAASSNIVVVLDVEQLEAAHSESPRFGALRCSRAGNERSVEHRAPELVNQLQIVDQFVVDEASLALRAVRNYIC